MSGVIPQRVRRHLGRHAAKYLALLVLVLTLVVALRFPVYFRYDDVHYLKWASEHESLLSAFRPSEGVVHDGMFRPFNGLVWWVAYHLFGLNPLPYQLALTLAYGLSFVLLFELVSLAFSRHAAVLSILAYLVLFPHLGYVVFWFSDTVFVFEVLFINLALYLFVRAACERPALAVWGIVSYVCGSLVKEPAIVIVPAAASAFVVARWRRLPARGRTRVAPVVLTLLVIGILWARLSPSLRRVQILSSSTELQVLLSMFARRWRYYGAQLLSGGGALVWASAAYLAVRSCTPRGGRDGRLRNYVFLGVAAVVAVLATRLPGWALPALFALMVPIVATRARGSFPVVWAAIPLAGILTAGPMIRTFLVEASFGLAALVGLAATEIVDWVWAEWRLMRRSLARAGAVALLAAICAVSVAYAPRARAALAAAGAVSTARQNFRDAVEFATVHLDHRGYHLVVPDYGELGEPLERGIRASGDVEKARLQKTMTSRELGIFIDLAGAEHLDVRNLAWLSEHREAPEVFMLAMNSYERALVLDLGLELDLVYEVERGAEGAWIFAVLAESPGDGREEQSAARGSTGASRPRA